MAPNMTPSPKKPVNWARISKTLSFWILVILIPVAFLSYGNRGEQAAPEIMYTDYRQQLDAGNIKQVVFQADNVLAGQFNQRVRIQGKDASRFTVQLVAGSAPDEQKLLFSRGVRTSSAGPRANFGSL